MAKCVIIFLLALGIPEIVSQGKPKLFPEQADDRWDLPVSLKLLKLFCSS
jgi:hypothetical protein